MSKEENLFKEFAPIDDNTWRKKVETDLKGKNPDELNWEPEAGIIAKPYYRKTTEDYSFSRSIERENNSWKILEEILVSDAKKANKEALNALEGGANALFFVIVNNVDCALLFNNIHLNYIEVSIKASNEFLNSFLSYVNEHETYKSIHGQLEFDESPEPSFLNEVMQTLPNFRCCIAKTNGLWIQKNQGAEGIAELLRQGQQTLEMLIDSGLTPKEAAGKIYFSGEANTHYFPQIAKQRAFIWLWDKILRLYDSSINQSTYLRVMTTSESDSSDPYNSLIAATTEALSAAIGGAVAIGVKPSKTERSRAFSKRIARNVHHLLAQESFVDRVVDPGAGSWYLENLTKSYAEKAWNLFRSQA